ncbi:MAG: glutamate--tRNA ligase family protein [Pontiella sp.]
MRTRFAPSLTGYLHLGHVLHLLYVWGVAHKMGAKIICRMEDHDWSRARPEYERAIFHTLDVLGLVPDLGISAKHAAGPSEFRQSDCGAYYESVLQRLEKRGLVYGCACSRKQIAAKQSQEAEELCYTGTCSDKGLPLEGNTVRFRTLAGETVFHDLNVGEQRQTPRNQCGDFSLRDRQGQWTYQFACVCDDLRQGVDLVIRGEDILFSTARQIQLFQTLEAPVPRYYHHPLLLDESGKKLSKRQHSESISRWYDAGATSEEIMGQALFAGGLRLNSAPCSLREALAVIPF